MTIIFFTTTGNSLHIAKSLGGRLLSIPRLLMAEDFTVTDSNTIGLVCPVYFGTVPTPVKEFLAKASINAPYTFAVLTYGSTPANAVANLQKIRRFDLVETVEMVDNYFPMFDVSKQTVKSSLEKVPEKIADIINNVAHHKTGFPPPTLYGRIADLYMRLFPASKSLYEGFRISSDLCSRCGTCFRVCPTGNITPGENRLPVMGRDCLMCGGCFHNCSYGAISHINQKSDFRYRNPAVSLKELIETNDHYGL